MVRREIQISSLFLNRVKRKVEVRKKPEERGVYRTAQILHMQLQNLKRLSNSCTWYSVPTISFFSFACTMQNKIRKALNSKALGPIRQLIVPEDGDIDYMSHRHFRKLIVHSVTSGWWLIIREEGRSIAEGEQQDSNSNNQSLRFLLKTSGELDSQLNRFFFSVFSRKPYCTG